MTKADLVRYRIDGIDLAVKDYRPRPFLVRNLLGRLAIRREAAAYRAAAGLAGLARYHGRPDAFSIALGWLPGAPLSELPAGRADVEEVFGRLEAIVARLHERGIAIGDLHHRDVLVSEDGAAHVVDLATSVVLGDSPGILRRTLFERLRDQDRIALARMRARHTGRDEEAAIAAVGPRAAARYFRWRRLRRAWDALRGRRRERGAGA